MVPGKERLSDGLDGMRPSKEEAGPPLKAGLRFLGNDLEWGLEGQSLEAT